MVNLKGKYAQYEPYVEDIISNIKDLMEEALKAKVCYSLIASTKSDILKITNKFLKG